MHFYLTIFLDDTQDGFLAQELSRFLAEGIKEDNAVVRTLKVNDFVKNDVLIFFRPLDKESSLLRFICSLDK